MKILISMVLVGLGGVSAFAHPSVVPHDHPHAISMLPDALALVIARCSLVPDLLRIAGLGRNSAMVEWTPGEIFVKHGEIELNAGREGVTLSVANTGDRPIQVGSHYHFFETNPALKFDRKKARGMRLDIAAGTAVRFEPGQTRDVDAGRAVAASATVYGFRRDVMGKLVMTTISRSVYADMFGPTVRRPRAAGRHRPRSSKSRRTSPPTARR